MAGVMLLCAAALASAQTSPLTVTITGPYAFKDTPVIASYQITATNSSPGLVSGVNMNQALSAIDGAYLVVAKPSQGSCDQGGRGITTLNCSVGNLDPGASATINVATQMVSNPITLSSSGTGIDSNGSSFSTTPVGRTTVHGNAPLGTSLVSISLSANPTPKDVVGGRAGTLNWTLQNSTGVRANKLMPAMVIGNRMRVSSSMVTGSNSGDQVSCTAPTPSDSGTNIIFCNIDDLGGSSGGSGSPRW